MDKRTDINTASFAYSVTILSLNYGNVTMNGIAVAWRRKILNRLVLSTVMEN